MEEKGGVGKGKEEDCREREENRISREDGGKASLRT